MTLIIDLIGAAVICGTLIIMMISFQFQMQEAVDRALYTINMVDHMDMAATKLNNVIALAGVGFSPTGSIIYAKPDSLVFNTYWNYQTDSVNSVPDRLSIKLGPAPRPYGTALILQQDGVPLDELGYLFWINEVQFKYYTKTDVYLNHASYTATQIAAQARSTEIRMSFFRNPPRAGGKPITTKLQFKCYFMNTYMQGA